MVPGDAATITAAILAAEADLSIVFVLAAAAPGDADRRSPLHPGRSHGYHSALEEGFARSMAEKGRTGR